MVSAVHGWSTAALTMAAAIGCWPGYPARARLASILRAPASLSAWLSAGSSAGRSRLARELAGWSRVVSFGIGGQQLALVVFAGLLGALVGGVGAATAAGLGAGMAGQRWHHARRRRRQNGELAALLEAVGVMVTELRAGAHPSAAAFTSAESTERGATSTVARRWVRSDDGTDSVRRVLGSVAAAARLGAEVPALLVRHARIEPVIGPELGRLAAAWSLAQRHGVALADLLDTVRSDLEARTRLAGQVNAQLAGPKSTAAVLAGLPILGLLLGQGVGANPWRVLTATPVGQLLLVLGTGLTCAGVAWSGQITSRAAGR